MNRPAASAKSIFAGLVLTLGFLCRLSAETPEEYSQRYLTALRTDGLKAVPAFLHEEEAKRLGDLILEIAELGEKAKQPIPFFAPTDTAEALRKLPRIQLGEKFFAWVQQIAPQMTDILKTAQARSVGHVADGDTVYVVTKLQFEMEGEPISTTDVLPLKKSGDSYKVLLKAEMTNMLKAMRKKLQAAK